MKFRIKEHKFIIEKNMIVMTHALAINRTLIKSIVHIMLLI